MSETIEQLQQKIFPLIQNQQLENALTIAQQACAKDKKNADKWLLLAGIYSYKQDMPKVEECCQKALALQPQHVNAHYNLAVAQQMQGDLTGAEQGYNTVIQLNKQHANAYAGLAQVLRMQNRFNEAIKHQQQALILMPDNPQFHYQIAALYQNNQQTELAKQHLNKTLKLAPNHPEALNNLGSLHHTLEELDQAMQCFNKALQIQPKNAQLHYNLSQCYWQQTNIEQAFLFALSALQLQEERPLFRQNFIQALAVIPEIPNAPEVIHQIEQSYNVEGVGWQNLLAPSLVIIRQNTIFSQLRTAAITDNYDAIYQELETKKLNSLLTNELLLNCLTHTVITIEQEEKLFTLLRRALLQFAISKNYKIDNNLIMFMAALACQCFNNEYAFAQTDNEIEQLDNLTTNLQKFDNKTLSKEDQVIVTILAMYQPLSAITQLQTTSFNKVTHHSKQWDLLIERQITQPREELTIKKSIKTLTQIENKTSQAVQEQYEDSPYPRWLSINLTKPRNYRQILQGLFPHFKAPIFPDSPLELLIAGCGTGSHAVITSTRFSGTNVLAIDLSRQSIAYAQRMANRNKINNLRFAHADILGLKNMDKHFHIIESIGVLHHMKKPEDGLKVLRNLLHTNGLINLGFYSTIARRYITQAREHFKETKPTTTNIRNARQEILALPKNNPLRTITGIRDFYSLSECRDLIFHTQEHCYTISEIKELITSCGLKFIGFELPSPSIKKQYNNSYPKDTQLNNLDNWEKFEEDNPDTFIGMYTFWCQR
ncbi:tetratricopeptide repeat protein, partial [Candidatus Pacearchaeota archaeon]|nr:tetratricopeptide repeat protein [Candidatus Pacearchaeota archaeon]